MLSNNIQKVTSVFPKYYNHTRFEYNLANCAVLYGFKTSVITEHEQFKHVMPKNSKSHTEYSRT